MWLTSHYCAFTVLVIENSLVHLQIFLFHEYTFCNAAYSEVLAVYLFLFLWKLGLLCFSCCSARIGNLQRISYHAPLSSVFIARYVLRSISFQVNLIAGAVDNTAGLKLHSFSVVLSSMRSPESRDWGLPDSRNLRILFVRIISAFIEQNKRLGSWAEHTHSMQLLHLLILLILSGGIESQSQLLYNPLSLRFSASTTFW